MTGQATPGLKGYQPTRDAWDQTYQRLAWQYGPERALKKLRGEDPESQADEEAWARLIGRAG